MAHAKRKKSWFRTRDVLHTFRTRTAELPLRQSRSANPNRFLDVYVLYCFVLRNKSTIETCQKIDHTIGMKIGLELLTQDKRNRIWAPIEKKKLKTYLQHESNTSAPFY